MKQLISRLDDNLFKEFKVKCVQKSAAMTEIVRQLVIEWLAKT